MNKCNKAVEKKPCESNDDCNIDVEKYCKTEEFTQEQVDSKSIIRCFDGKYYQLCAMPDREYSFPHPNFWKGGLSFGETLAKIINCGDDSGGGSTDLPKNACGTEALTSSSKVVEAGDYDPLFFNVEPSSTRVRFRGDGIYVNLNDYNLLEREDSALVINNPYACAELVVHLTGGGRLGWNFDATDHASALLGGGLDGWTSLLVDGEFKSWLASNALVNSYSHTFRHYDALSDVVTIPAGGSIVIGREVQAANADTESGGVPLDPSATIWNMPDICAICFPKYL